MSIDFFINNMEGLLCEKEQPEKEQPEKEQPNEKIKKIERLIDSTRSLFAETKHPAYAEKVQNLAKSISSLSIEAAHELTGLADEMRFPLEVMNLIVQRYVLDEEPKKLGALIQTSKETRKQAVEAYRGSLESLNIQTKERAIEFAKEFGSGLAFINISHTPFSLELLQWLPNLKTLIASDCRLTLEEIKAIVASPNAAKLQTLDLSLNRGFGTGLAMEIAQSPHLTGLKRLILAYNDLNGFGAIYSLATSSTLTRLEALDLTGNSLSFGSGMTIGNSENLKSLKELTLDSNRLGCVGAKGIARLTQLKVLNLAHNDIGTEGVRAISTLPSLQQLNLSNNCVSDAGAEILAASQTQLQVLDLAGTQISEAGVRAVSTLPALQQLDLSDNNLSCSAGILTTSQTLSNLRVLRIANANLANEIFSIAASRNLPNLERILVGVNDIPFIFPPGGSSKIHHIPGYYPNLNSNVSVEEWREEWRKDWRNKWWAAELLFHDPEILERILKKITFPS